jgi:hypothetical protein
MTHYSCAVTTKVRLGSKNFINMRGFKLLSPKYLHFFKKTLVATHIGKTQTQADLLGVFLDFKLPTWGYFKLLHLTTLTEANQHFGMKAKHCMFNSLIPH